MVPVGLLHQTERPLPEDNVRRALAADVSQPAKQVETTVPNFVNGSCTAVCKDETMPYIKLKKVHEHDSCTAAAETDMKRDQTVGRRSLNFLVHLGCTQVYIRKSGRQRTG